MSRVAHSHLPSDRAGLDEHIAQFEHWFRIQQRQSGMEGSGLISVEHAILRSYIVWLKSTGGTGATADQTE
jgi:hypothetical protein